MSSTFFLLAFSPRSKLLVQPGGLGSPPPSVPWGNSRYKRQRMQVDCVPRSTCLKNPRLGYVWICMDHLTRFKKESLKFCASYLANAKNQTVKLASGNTHAGWNKRGSKACSQLCWNAAALCTTVSLGKDCECLLSHQVAHLLGLGLVLLWDVIKGGIGCVILAVSGQATRDAHAGAIELPHNPLLLLSWGSYWRGKDEVSSPPKWNWLLCQIQGRHHMGQVCLQEVFGQILEEWLLWSIEGVDGASSANCRNATLFWFLVNDTNQRISNEIVAELTFHNTWAEALVHQLATCLFSTFQILSDALGGPFTWLVVATVHAELNELCNSVLLTTLCAFCRVDLSGLSQEMIQCYHTT